MPRYDFNTILLSAQKTGNPPVTNALLSSNGVNVISLNSADKGIAFNRLTTLSNTLCSLNAFGSIFLIDKNYNGSPMAIANNFTYTYFTYASSFNILTTSLAASGNSVDIWEPNKSRLHLLGYR